MAPSQGMAVELIGRPQDDGQAQANASSDPVWSLATRRCPDGPHG
jgi:hypothetical protein